MRVQPWWWSLMLLLRSVGGFICANTLRRRCFLCRSSFSTHATVDDTPPITNALLKVSFHGRRFTGWTSGDATTNRNSVYYYPESRRNVRKYSPPSGFVRSVQGVLQQNLAKLFGKVAPHRVVVEGCSRTDKGVHATGLVCQIYCLKEDYDGCLQSPIPGKRLPHPRNATDTSCFEEISKQLPDLAFSLNRMCHDLQVVQVAVPPANKVFHPTLSSTYKTYRYTISTGPFPDACDYQTVWHVGPDFDMFLLEQVLPMLQGTHAFGAFEGAPRGVTDKRRRAARSTTCTLSNLTITPAKKWQNTTTYTIEVTADRFLYKMARFLVGALVAVAQGKLALEEVEECLRTESRDVTFTCAPAHALVLHSVEYDVPIDWQTVNA